MSSLPDQLPGLIDTGYQPRWFQQEIHEQLARFSVLVMHRRAGKTVLAVNTLINAALTCPKTNPRFAYIAPFRSQAKNIAWDYFKLFTRNIPGVSYNESELAIDLPNGARIRLFGADNPDALRGQYFDGVVLDEYADMRSETWGEVIRPALADRLGWCLFIGTPRGLNAFSEIYEYAQRDPAWFAACYDVMRTKAINDNELQLARATMSEAQYRQEMLCDFSASMDNVLITIDMVADAVKRHMMPAELKGAVRVLGVDVARYGDDRSVIMRRQGLAAWEPEIHTGIDNMDLAGRVARHIEQWKPDAVFIDAGRGEGVIDRLRQLGHDVIEVNFGGRPTSAMYANKRSEMWDKMREWFRAGGVIPDHPDLKRDLVTPTYAMMAGDKLALEKKDDIKARGLPSPDVGDALALTFAMPVIKRPEQHLLQDRNVKQGFAIHDYDPFAEDAA